ncbi:MAG: amidohydrolase family protein [Gammaproteobacteria bacterium]
MSDRIDADGLRLPIKLDSTSNGEFWPRPLGRAARYANALARQWTDANARRLGIGRRRFMISACGAASTLLAFNEAFAAAGKTGGGYDLHADAAFDPQLAAAKLSGDEFIFDVQGHYVNPRGAWVKKTPPPKGGIGWAPASMPDSCPPERHPGDYGYLECIGPDAFIREVFLDSDTDMMVLSFVPSLRDAEPVTLAEAEVTRGIVERMEGGHRLLLHARTNPNQAGDLEGMEEVRGRWNIAAWKTYTQWGPDGRGFSLADETIGIPFLEKVRRLGPRIVCVHKGIPFGKDSYEYSRCDDIGVVAKRYPDIAFLVYHSGFDPDVPERAFAPGERRDGIDSFVQTILDNGIGKHSNVYAELGSTWRYLMRDPDGAAHALGKLVNAVGEDNVLWGTDSIWYGSPQDQIQAFRAFRIADALREKHGYPELTPQVKAKILGLNAARVYGIDPPAAKQRAAGDAMSRARAEYANDPQPLFQTHGPRTRREFLALLSTHPHR